MDRWHIQMLLGSWIIHEKKNTRGQASEKQEENELKKRREEDLKKIESLRKSNKELLGRESEAEEMLKSACTFLEEGKEKMAKGLADKNMDEIEAAQKIIQLAQEKQGEKSKGGIGNYGQKRES